LSIAELVEYAETHRAPTPDDFLHKRLIYDITSKLGKLGIPEDAAVHSEVAEIERGRMIGAVDLLVVAGDMAYLIEAKTLDNNKSKPSSTYRAIRLQLEKARDFFQRYGVPTICIGVYRRTGAKRFHHYFIEPNSMPELS
jgi:hypothetical protein